MNANLYACGGAGLNVARYFETYRGKAEKGFATITPIYIDTSKSNLANNLDKDSLYLVEGLDGSGKVRSANNEVIGERVLDMLHQFPPADLNVVLSSGGGGSGSVIAPSLVSELAKRGVPTIVIMIGSTDSKIEISNNVRTLKSYEAIANMRGTPVVALYFENSETTSRKAVDADIHTTMVYLASIFSGENRELDSSDLKNWLNYTKVTSYPARLVALELFDKTIVLDKGFAAISVATLANEDGPTSAGYPVEYQTVGYMPKEVPENTNIEGPLHAVIVDGKITDIFKRLDKELQNLDEASAARVGRGSILDSKDKPTGNGLIV